nr:SprT family zinc-dependent metalloprotease [uncultured Desulfobacter sp.]
MHDLSRFFPAAPKGWEYELIYKPIRHIYFRIYTDKKIVRISAPFKISSKELAQAIQVKSAWLMEKMRAFASAPVPLNPGPALRDNRSCMVWGKSLAVVRENCTAQPRICLTSESEITVRVPPDFGTKKEESLWNRWLRSLLNERIQLLLGKWQPAMGIAPSECRLKKMKTRWGSCNTRVKRIWINACLVHLDPSLLEYVLVHELVHLLEPGHTRRFYEIVKKYLPDWKDRESRLNQIELKLWGFN